MLWWQLHSLSPLWVQTSVLCCLRSYFPKWNCLSGFWNITFSRSSRGLLLHWYLPIAMDMTSNLQTEPARGFVSLQLPPWWPMMTCRRRGSYFVSLSALAAGSVGAGYLQKGESMPSLCPAEDYASSLQRVWESCAERYFALHCLLGTDAQGGSHQIKHCSSFSLHLTSW